MDTVELLKLVLESLYKYPTLQVELEKSSRKNKLRLEIVHSLSRFYNRINNFATGTLFITMIAYVWSFLAFISLEFFDLRLNPYFLIYLIIITSITFMITILIKMVTLIILNSLDKKILKEFKISNTEKYQGNYIVDDEKYFKTIPDNDYRSIPKNKLSSVKLNRKKLDTNIKANGIITELISKQSQYKIFIQLELVN